jgi:hypothetical protein
VVHPATRVLLCGGYNETCAALGQVTKQWWSVPVACLVLLSVCCHCGVVVVVKYILYMFWKLVYVSFEQPLYLPANHVAMCLTIDEVWIGNRIYSTLKQFLTTNNYDNLRELHTAENIRSFQSSLAVAWYRLQRRTFPLLWVPEISGASATKFSLLKIKVKVTLRLAIYRQSNSSWRQAP